MHHDVELHQRGAAETVDEEQTTAAALCAEIPQHRADDLRRDAVGRRKRDASTTGLAMDADAHLHLIVGKREGRFSGRRNRA